MKLKFFRAFGLVHMREQETYQKNSPQTCRHEPQNNPKKSTRKPK